MDQTSPLCSLLGHGQHTFTMTIRLPHPAKRKPYDMQPQSLINFAQMDTNHACLLITSVLLIFFAILTLIFRAVSRYSNWCVT